jgi:dTDP-4-dehydrorhamnose reductase
MNNVVLFGCDGMLGTYIKSFFTKQNNIILKCINRKSFDVLKDLYNLESLLNTFDDNSIIINCIGLIPQSIKKNNINDKEYYLINSIYPIILSVLCDKKNFKLIHITTDCVFSGSKGDYIECDYHDCVTSYGISKSFAENLNIISTTTIIRTSIIGEELHNKYSLLEWVKNNNNNKIDGYENHIWNGVTCLELSKIIYQIIINKLYWKGVRHIFTNEKISKHDLIKLIIETYGLNIILTKKNDIVNCDRSLNTIYDAEINILNLKEQLNELKDYIL